MKEQLRQIEAEAAKAIEAAATLGELEGARLRFLGKKGELTSILRGMSALSAEERPAAGQLVNAAREGIERRLEAAKGALAQQALERRLADEAIDITLPGRSGRLGHKHPITLASEQICEVFLGMGFQIAEGPEIEYDHYNFEMLNIPKGHPVRDTHDTYYIDDNIVLRTHTSPVQVRTMLSQPLPIRIICPGRTYRSDTADATHSPVFHQAEGLVVDRGVTMGDLIGTLQLFAEKVFGESTKIRLRPSYFPFTEPSAEVDVTCWVCGGRGCRVCKGEGYVELLGAGMVNPKVLSMCGIDPDIYSGFAFGVGIERTATCKYGIDSLKLLFDNDIRFLRQF
jgi:phenylalanyl-tRNA synthetase alpha chain